MSSMSRRLLSATLICPPCLGADTLIKETKGELVGGLTGIILAGGLGTRLRSVVSEVPKALAPVAGRPFLAWLLDFLSINGFSRVILATGYKGEMILDAFGETYKGMSLIYSKEESPLGTGGALAKAIDFVQTEYVFVINGDTWITLDYRRFLQFVREEQKELAMALANVDDVARYGAVELGVDGNILGLLEKGASGSGKINGGVYLMRKSVLNFLPAKKQFSFEAEVLPQLVNKLSVKGYTETSDFIDIGVPSDYAKAQLVIAQAVHA